MKINDIMLAVCTAYVQWHFRFLFRFKWKLLILVLEYFTQSVNIALNMEIEIKYLNYSLHFHRNHIEFVRHFYNTIFIGNYSYNFCVSLKTLRMVCKSLSFTHEYKRLRQIIVYYHFV